MHAPYVDSLRPWRTATLVAAGVAAVELVLLLVAAFALFGQPLVQRVRGVAASKPPAAAARKAVAPPQPIAPVERRPSLARTETSILVLNGNGVSGAAGRTAAQVRSRGYRVARVGDAGRRDYARSIVMYRKGYRAEARRFARDLGVGIVGPLDGLRTAELGGAHLALIVGG